MVINKNNQNNNQFNGERIRSFDPDNLPEGFDPENMPEGAQRRVRIENGDGSGQGQKMNSI